MFCCGKYQNFKEQKQFTTVGLFLLASLELWQISEFQGTKAIHNFYPLDYQTLSVVANIRISRNKSNSQHIVFFAKNLFCCGKYQNFKEQKQFTTNEVILSLNKLLWQISEFQGTKAIHNTFPTHY